MEVGRQVAPPQRGDILRPDVRDEKETAGGGVQRPSGGRNCLRSRRRPTSGDTITITVLGSYRRFQSNGVLGAPHGL